VQSNSKLKAHIDWIGERVVRRVSPLCAWCCCCLPAAAAGRARAVPVVPTVPGSLGLAPAASGCRCRGGCGGDAAGTRGQRNPGSECRADPTEH
jgi:hypothetical protein